MPPSADDFRTALYQHMSEAFKKGATHVDVSAGDLHRRVGDYPGPDHRMPNCSSVMRQAYSPVAGDRILEEPPSGQGASLTIRYILPRAENPYTEDGRLR